MAESFFHRLSNILWGFLVLLLLVLAFYVSLGRLAVSSLGYYQDALLQELNVRVPFSIEADTVRGEWRSFSPVFVFSGLRMSLPDSAALPLELTEGRFRVDVWASLRSRSLQFSHLFLDGLNLHGEFSSAGKLRLRGLASSGGESGDWLQQFILNTQQIVLRDNNLRLSLANGEVRDFDLNLQLARSGSDRRAQGTLVSANGTQIDVLANGLGNPFLPDLFSGDLYVDAASTDLGAIRALFGDDAPALWPQGELDVEFWLNWDRGKTSLETQVEARDLVITPREGDWQLPLKRIAFAAHVVRTEDRWTLYAADVALANEAISLDLPQLQIDAWGNALRLRARDIPVASFAAFTAGLETIPPQGRQLITDLNPRGRLPKLQLNISDFERPLQEWEFEANFNDVSLAPYRGAPGAKSAAGYAQFGSGGGTVVLDSRDMALSFPGIYAKPLTFDEFFGSLYLDWDSQSLSLSSGLITAVGDEGRVRALFGLDVPLQPNEIGVEMELLVGLADTDISVREKYVPQALSEGLRGWLSKSVVSGDISAGAFLWRGALKREARALRTVQLALNVSNAEIDYHPDWPAVQVADAVIFVDDRKVSGWAPSGELLNSNVQNLSVEIAPDAHKRTQLAVHANIDGPAVDGLSIVNDSPLTKLVGSTFKTWRMDGDLEIDLNLKLQLSKGAPPPQVDVQTRWTDVNATVAPGDLPFTKLNGELAYSSAKGFSSRDLAGRLWDKKIALAVRQLPAVTVPNSDSRSPLEVSAVTRIAMSDLQNWLGIAPLAMASGEAPFELALRVGSGAAPILEASSSLVGIRLDLPPPWRKKADEATALSLRLSMPSGRQDLSLELAEALALELTLEAGKLRSGALGVAVDAPEAAPNEFRVTGAAPAIDAPEVFQFIRRYLIAGAGSSGADGVLARDAESAAKDTETEGALETQESLRIIVQDFSAESVSWAERTLADVNASLTLADGVTNAVVAGDWLRGRLRWARSPEPVELKLDYLDFSQLALLEAPVESVADATVEETVEKTAETAVESATKEVFSFGDLPPLAISVAELYQGEKHLGNVAFNLNTSDSGTVVDELQGEIARLRFGSETPASIRWGSGENSRTQVSGRLSFEDLGTALAYFGYEKIIQTRKGDIDIALTWPGEPTSFALAEAGGSVLLDVDSGSFLNAPSGTEGALRVVNILNLVHIVQRLSLKHMFDSGIPFDGVTGEVYFHQGTIEVPSLAVEGGSKFEFSGVSDVATRSLDGELVATLPVAKNLPWVAALAAGLPVAAGVFVVSKIFDRQVNRLSSAVYRLDGTWDEPTVNFDRIFDDSRKRLPQRSKVQLDPNAPIDEESLRQSPATDPLQPNDPNDALAEMQTSGAPARDIASTKLPESFTADPDTSAPLDPNEADKALHAAP